MGRSLSPTTTTTTPTGSPILRVLEFAGVLLGGLAQEGGGGVGGLGALRGALLGRGGGGLLSRALDPLLKHAHLFLR